MHSKHIFRRFSVANPKIHPLAPEHIPRYVVQADGSDYLFTFMVVFTGVMVLLIGVMYFALHSVPEKMAHKSNHPQFQLVGILALLALFTHNGLFGSLRSWSPVSKSPIWVPLCGPSPMPSDLWHLVNLPRPHKTPLSPQKWHPHRPRPTTWHRSINPCWKL